MAYDPDFPPPYTRIRSDELRGQFNALNQNIQAKANEDDCVGRVMASAMNPSGVALLGLSIGDPPLQSEVQALANKLDELITALKRS
jgi:hypothetical protein